jgi:hypothetical protein
MRKSFDETGSRHDEKYGERFWQSQVQRMLKQSQNYSMLYNTNKKIRDKEKSEIRSENDKLQKIVKEMEEKMQKMSDEIKSYKEQLINHDIVGSSKKMIIMKPKKKIQIPIIKEEIKSYTTDHTPQVELNIQTNPTEIKRPAPVS